MSSREIINLNGVSLAYDSESNRRTFKSMAVASFNKHKPIVKQSFQLRNINLKIGSHELIGLIGRNGSGKSTLLKVISGVLPPANGTISCVGQVAPVVDIDTGMHPDLSCIDNIFLSSSYFGRSRRETNNYVSRIIEWAELQDLQHEPFHSLSTGAKARLAFAVASSSSPDLLLIDEAISVGDLKFQEKIDLEIASMVYRGSSVIIVSHDLEYLNNKVSRVIWLQDGSIFMDGLSENVIMKYRESF